MKRLTIHLKQVPHIDVAGKSKLFNTLSFRVGGEKDVNQILQRFDGNVSKSYLSNIN